jgi:hypothetical protein
MVKIEKDGFPLVDHICLSGFLFSILFKSSNIHVNKALDAHGYY